MNKTLMLVVCDFLLLSMLALARFDMPDTSSAPSLDPGTAMEAAEAELIELLEQSLEAELSSRENLTEDLSQTRQNLQEQARLLAEREAALETTQRELEAKASEAEQLSRSAAEIEAERQRLAEEKAQIEAEKLSITGRFESTREQLEAANRERVELTRDVGALREESSLTKERLDRTAEDLVARERALADREAALKAAEERTAQLAEERQQLNRRLGIVEAERSMLEQNLTKEQQEKALLRAEKEQAFARADLLTENVSQLGQGFTQLGQGVTQLGQGVTQLGEGVTTLSRSSEAIQEELDASRPRTMSEIFTRFQKNRASLRFTAEERNLFGNTVTRTYESTSILARDDGAIFLVTHSTNTPFSLSRNPGSLVNVRMEIDLGERTYPVNQIGFLSADPRIVFIPLADRWVEEAGLETFALAKQPDRWEEAVLIKSDESNFGQTNFRRLTTSARFLKMDRPALGQLFANFASSRGDLAFTKNSRFIGLMTDTTHAVVVDSFLAAAVIEIGNNFDPATTASTLERLRDRLRQLPSEVQ